MMVTISALNTNAKASIGYSSVAARTLPRLLSSSMPRRSPAASRRLMLGRNACCTDTRHRCTRGLKSAAIENEANIPTENNAVATH